MVDDTAKLVSLLRAEVNVPAGDNDRLVDKVTAAIEYVDSAIGGANGSAADLYNSRDARLGVMDVGEGSPEPYRASSDPLGAGWATPNAAGVPTGGLVIA